jgi:hypothetical protein
MYITNKLDEVQLDAYEVLTNQTYQQHRRTTKNRKKTKIVLFTKLGYIKNALFFPPFLDKVNSIIS